MMTLLQMIMYGIMTVQEEIEIMTVEIFDKKEVVVVVNKEDHDRDRDLGLEIVLEHQGYI